MDVGEVLRLYRALDERGVAARIDGGWCVDALLGRQTRPHADLDLAVDLADEPGLLAVLGALGYHRVSGSPENYVMADDREARVDVHVCPTPTAARRETLSRRHRRRRRGVGPRGRAARR